MKIATGSDHAGFKLKEVVRKHLFGKGIEVKDFGTYTEDSVGVVAPAEIVAAV